MRIIRHHSETTAPTRPIVSPDRFGGACVALTHHGRIVITRTRTTRAGSLIEG
jgi:hemin uptake protein HemP